MSPVKDPATAERFFKRKEESADYLTMATLAIGMAGMFMQSKLFSWIAIIMWLSSIANMKTTDTDYTQMFSAFIFVRSFSF
jgi:hypothetical protein